ncbi:CLUMA_CG011088, isoform A [Clunio marinus]|uniref:CLUMA_CG011088, isoform A n=1 Tax=Clunio marinus TaxID=568069 RepID=A0A1J1IDT0_9DIPT|nr:CLUMA_CG011088, isoform A [Clunio marinus]
MNKDGSTIIIVESTQKMTMRLASVDREFYYFTKRESWQRQILIVPKNGKLSCIFYHSSVYLTSKAQ